MSPSQTDPPLVSSLDIYRADIPWELLTDTYSMTMPQAWIDYGWFNKRAVFYAHFRKLLPNVGYAVLGGTDIIADWIRRVQFNDDTLHWMSQTRTKSGERYFHDPFLDKIRGRRLSVNLDAFPEGSIVFPHEPLIVGSGYLWELAFIEGALLNLSNQYTALMSKASRMVLAAGGLPVADNSLRRGRGVGGSIDTAIGAFRGGVLRTSNMLAARLFGISISGTMAHCFVGSFEQEEEAFIAYAKSSPGNTVFLVDTYNTISGIRTSIRVGLALKKIGRKLNAIRLDSGDLAELAKRARGMLTEAGLNDVEIIGTNSLTELTIGSLRAQEAPITLWATGDALAEPGLPGIIWKLSAVEGTTPGEFRHVMKLSEQPIKNSVPGNPRVRRFFGKNGEMLGDAIYDSFVEDGNVGHLIDVSDYTNEFAVGEVGSSVDPLIALVREGEACFPVISHADVQKAVVERVNGLSPVYTRHDNPHKYPVGLTTKLADARLALTRKSRRGEFSRDLGTASV